MLTNCGVQDSWPFSDILVTMTKPGLLFAIMHLAMRSPYSLGPGPSN